MGERVIDTDTSAVLLAAGLYFLWALGLGIIKYRQIAASPVAQAHPYIDIAHRAALLYSFATLLMAVFVELSAWSDLANLIAAFSVFFFFVAATAGYMYHGLKKDTDNQFVDPVPGTHPFMWTLIVVEMAGFAFLVAGFVDAQML